MRLRQTEQVANHLQWRSGTKQAHCPCMAKNVGAALARDDHAGIVEPIPNQTTQAGSALERSIRGTIPNEDLPKCGLRSGLLQVLQNSLTHFR